MSPAAVAGDRREAAGDGRLVAGMLRFVAGYFLRGPDDETEEILTDVEWQRATTESGLIPAAVADETLIDLDEHRRQFSELFRVPGTAFIPPFEQAYRGGKATVESSATTECLRLYAAAGYRLHPFKHAQADHAGHQARFLAALLEQEAGCLADGEAGTAATVATWRQGFVAEHCGWWTDFSDRATASGACQQIRTAATLLASLGRAAERG